MTDTAGSGSVLWQQSYGSLDGNYYVNSLRETINGDYILAGRFQASESQLHAWLMRVDALGNSDAELRKR